MRNYCGNTWFDVAMEYYDWPMSRDNVNIFQDTCEVKVKWRDSIGRQLELPRVYVENDSVRDELVIVSL